ncbi:ribonuclease HI family protein [Candidatus Gottesmanbacteria bacterium]|nr:ribonuclease HI family protein [Candidatus Gottesmanbacteria bacterium]
MKFIIHTDGGARGNPGPAAIGVVIEDSGRKTITEFGKRIGVTTNNVAEYTAVREALRSIKKEEGIEVDFFLDSTLVTNQLNGRFKVKDMKLRELLFDIRSLEQGLGGNIHYHVIPREQNRRADFLVNRALDNF